MKYDIPTMTAEAVSLLKSLISIPSISREETQAADFLQNYIEAEGMQTGRKGNNVWCLSPMFDLKKPTILLNSHIDTVKPVMAGAKTLSHPARKTVNYTDWAVTTPEPVLFRSYRCSCNYVALLKITISSIWLPAKKKFRVRRELKVYYRGYPCFIRYRRRTYGDATCHCRKGVDGTGCNCYGKSRTCRTR